MVRRLEAAFHSLMPLADFGFECGVLRWAERRSLRSVSSANQRSMRWHDFTWARARPHGNRADYAFRGCLSRRRAGTVHGRLLIRRERSPSRLPE